MPSPYLDGACYCTLPMLAGQAGKWHSTPGTQTMMRQRYVRYRIEGERGNDGLQSILKGPQDQPTNLFKLVFPSGDPALSCMED